MIVAGLACDFASHEVTRSLEVEEEDLCFQQARVHPASDACALPLVERCHDPEREESARDEIVDRNTDAHRAVARDPRDRHEPAHPLRNLVDATFGRIRTVLSEPADAAVDEPRIDRFHVVVGNLEAMLHLGPHVLNEHIGARDQPLESFVSGFGFEIEPNRAFIAMEVLEIAAVAAPHNVLARWHRRLYTNDVRAPVGKMPDARRTCPRKREVENENVG